MSLNREQLTAFVGAVVRFGEISTRSPYVSSYSTGLSGLSYGVFQHDTSKNDGAQSTLALILSAEVERGALTRKKADALYTATIKSTASKKLSAANRELIDQALLAQQPIVDSADKEQLSVVMDYVDSAFDAASRNPNGAGDLDRADPNLALIAEMAMWANRSNGLDASNKFVEKMEVVTKDAWSSNYLAQQAQFEVRGESFTKWTAKVENGIIKGHIAVLTGQLNPLITAVDITDIDLSNLSGLMTPFDPAALICFPADTAKYIRDEFGVAETTRSPLVLDLDGDGVNTLGLDAGVYFDHDGDGRAERTGWVNPSDGLLVNDRNSDGQITSGSELFGNYSVMSNGTLAPNGFAALAELDTNNDGVIDSHDEHFDQLGVWVDENSNALVDAQEVFTLHGAGVQKLSTSHADSFVDPHGHLHQKGSFETVTGTLREMDDVWFQVDPSTTMSSAHAALTRGVRDLPDIRGIGSLPSLHEAVVFDSSGRLKRYVENFIAGDYVERQQLLPLIIFAWTGVLDQSSSRRATLYRRQPVIDDTRKLEALEALIGRDYLGIWCWGKQDANPHRQAAAILVPLFDKFAGEVYAKLMLQTEYGDILATVNFADAAGNSVVDTKAMHTSLLGDYQMSPLDATTRIADFALILLTLGNMGREILGSLKAHTCEDAAFSVLLKALGPTIASENGLSPVAPA